MLEELGEYPGFVPGVVLSAVAAVALSGWAACRLGTARGAALLLIASLGLVAAATLTPGREALAGAVANTLEGCDLSRLGPAPLASYLAPGEAFANVLLFLPLGVAVAMLRRSSRAGLVALGAVALPFGIEGAQLILTPLGRACQAADVSDNLAGLAIGLVLGLVAEAAGGRREHRAPPDGPVGTGPVADRH